MDVKKIKYEIMSKVKLMLGDNIESLKKLPDNSIDSVVSDPPYGLSFMGKKWDYDVPSVEFWKEVYRVLKPGGHVLSFGGTRTYHRMVVNIEDAGFEIRDQIMWIYGSGFPKSHNIGKAVDKLEGNERKIGKSKGTYVSSGGQLLGENTRTERFETKGSSPYEGWGTALKPANEPICLARKPLSEKSVAENVLKWRTGGINIDDCRIKSFNDDDIKRASKPNIVRNNSEDCLFPFGSEPVGELNQEGRFPANIILDETAAEMLDEQSGKLNKQAKCKTDNKSGWQNDYVGGNGVNPVERKLYLDQGGASRFFYIAKVSKKERNMGLDRFESKLQAGAEFRPNHMEKALRGEDGNPYGRYTPTKNNHPTVKPITLMTYLCRLITPPGGIVLDPFMGSGSTGIAARLEGFKFCGMELDADYFKIAKARIENYEKYRDLLKK